MTAPNFHYGRSIRRVTAQLIDIFNEYQIVKYSQPSPNVFIPESAIPVPIRFGPYEKLTEEIMYDANPSAYASQNPLHPILTLPRMGLSFDGMVYDGNRQQANFKPFPIYTHGASGWYKTHMPVPVIMNFTLFAYAKYYDEIIQLYEQVFEAFYPIMYVNMPIEELDIAKEYVLWPVKLNQVTGPTTVGQYASDNNPYFETTFGIRVLGYIYKYTDSSNAQIFKVSATTYTSSTSSSSGYMHDHYVVSATSAQIVDLSAASAIPLSAMENYYSNP